MIAYQIVTILGFFLAVAVPCWCLWLNVKRNGKSEDWFKVQMETQAETLRQTQETMVRACGAFYGEARTLSQQTQMENLSLMHQRSAVAAKKAELDSLVANTYAPPPPDPDAPIHTGHGGMTEEALNNVTAQIAKGEMPAAQLRNIAHLLPESVRKAYPTLLGQDIADTMMAGDNG